MCDEGNDDYEEDYSIEHLIEGENFSTADCLNDSEGVGGVVKVLRCRERNRIHARNTRERKKVQVDEMQLKIEKLYKEKQELEKMLQDTTVADILVSLSSKSQTSSDNSSDGTSNDSVSSHQDEDEEVSKTLQSIRMDKSFEYFNEDELNLEPELLKKQRSECTPEELERIRRERNRVHAKRTRIRKKRMMLEMETTISTLEEKVASMREKVETFQQVKAKKLKTMEQLQPCDQTNITVADTKSEFRCSLPGNMVVIMNDGVHAYALHYPYTFVTGAAGPQCPSFQPFPPCSV